jgi:hypothetical protein
MASPGLAAEPFPALINYLLTEVKNQSILAATMTVHVTAENNSENSNMLMMGGEATDTTHVFGAAAIAFTIENVLLAAFLICLALATILGNTFVLLAICMDVHLRLPTHFLMGSLAMADLLLGSLVLPFSSVQLYFDTWPFGSWYCEVWLGMRGVVF